MGRPGPGTAALLAVAVGGALGAVLRYGVDVAAGAPVGGLWWLTLVVNVTGTGALAFLGVLRAVRTRPVLRALLGPGLLGGWTTLSTYAEQGRQLVAADRPWLALAYLAGTLAGCLLAGAAAATVGQRREARRPVGLGPDVGRLP